MRWSYWAWVITLPTHLMLAVIASSVAAYVRGQWKMWREIIRDLRFGVGVVAHAVIAWSESP